MDKALLQRVNKQAWFHKYPRAIPALIFLAVATVTLLSVFAMEHADAQRRRTELDRNGTEVSTSLQRRAAENIAYLRAAAALFAVKPEVTRQEFERLASDLVPTPGDQGALGLGWTPRVPVSEIAAFETMMRTTQNGTYTIRPRPAAGRTDVFPIAYLVPGTFANIGAQGYDMSSDTIRSAAMTKAARIDEPVVSGGVLLVQNNSEDDRRGFLIYMPVFAYHANGNRTLRGFVYAPLRAEEFLRSASELHVARGVNVALYDEVRSPDHLLAQKVAPGTVLEGGLEKRITVGNHQWIVVIAETRRESFSVLSQTTLLSGALVALLLTVIAHYAIKRAAEDRQVLEWLSHQAGIRTTLTRELNHRVKNTLANVLSIVALTRRRAASLDDFVDSLSGRIRALSATHDLLTRSEWGATRLGDVVSSELAPYLGSQDSHVEMEGPPIDLAPNDALSLGLAIHELATNAAKYGALSQIGGHVRVTWAVADAGLAKVEWRESGGPPVAQPLTRGFGRDLIEKIVAHELKTEVQLEFLPEGVRCTLRIPVRAIRPSFAIRQGR